MIERAEIENTHFDYNAKLYRGYIPLMDKERICKEVYPSIEEVIQHYPKCNGIGGVLADGVMYLDFDYHNDTEEERQNIETYRRIVKSERLNCINRRTTNGLHSFFLNSEGKVSSDKAGTFIAVGLKADVKCKNNDYDILIYKGKYRTIEYESDSIGEIPSYLLPINRGVSFLGFKEGDGRNQALFVHILTLTCAGLREDETRECLRIINEYVFAESLSKKELEQLAREEAFPKIFIVKNKLLHDKFGDYLINELSVKKVNGIHYLFNGKCYEPHKKNGYLNEVIIKHIPSLKVNQRNEVIKYIEGRGGLNFDGGIDNNHVCFLNGLYNITTGKLEPHNPDIFVTNIIPHNYIKNVYSKRMDKALNDWCNGDTEVRKLLEEAVGSSFYPTAKYQKMFIVYGKMKNGKSTFFNTLQMTIGKGNYSNLQMNEMGERFSLVELQNKMVNIGDDLPKTAINQDSISKLKIVSTGGTVEAEFKGQDKFSFVPTAKLWFSANEIPYIKDNGALARRIIVIPFEHYFDSDVVLEKEKQFTEEDIEYLIQVSLKGLSRLIKNGGNFTMTERLIDLKDKVVTYLNSVKEFIKFSGGVQKIENQSCEDVYRKYESYCENTNSKAVRRSKFKEELLETYGLTSDMRKGMWVYVKAKKDKERDLFT